MFELSIAWKYLLPKRRQLSVSIISLISILVISLVIWLILVFFSVSRGLEKGWIEKLTALTSPIRVTPTEAYFKSYYFQVDKVSGASDYALRSIGEKLSTPASDPYNPESDQELPSDFPAKDLDAEGRQKDIVKLAFAGISELSFYQGLKAEEFFIAPANLRLRLIRGIQKGKELSQAFLNHAVYVGSKNPAELVLLKPTVADLDHAKEIAFVNIDEERLDNPERVTPLRKKIAYGEPIFVPKGFRESGILQGDRGYLAYHAPTASSIQEQRQPVYVAGFYDPGIVPLGGKFILASQELVSALRSAQQQDLSAQTNGIGISIANLDQVDALKKDLEAKFENAGIAPYWHVETFREFDFAKDLLQQLRSEKHIFSLISLVILTVACSNVISMLIILVNNKRVEIGILRSMGASSFSIAAIFGICGFTMGLIGTLLGSILAYATLKNLDALLSLISSLQGYDAFNPLFYGETLPNAMSGEVLMTVLIATGVLSLIAGVVPALKAARVQPAEILRSEG